MGGKKKGNVQILKPTADKLVGRCAAVSMNRLSDRLEWRRHLIGGQLSSGNSIAMATATWLRMGAVGRLVTYCVIFAGTYIAYPDIAFIFDCLLLFHHGWILCLSEWWWSGEWSFRKMWGAFGCQCFTNERFVNLAVLSHAEYHKFVRLQNLLYRKVCVMSLPMYVSQIEREFCVNYFIRVVGKWGRNAYVCM